MKKINTLLSLSLLSTLLIACGGGGGGSSSSSSNNTQENEQKYSNVNASYYVLSRQSNDTSYTMSHEITYVNGLQPANVNYHTVVPENEFILSPEGLYTDTWAEASTKAKTETQLIFSQVSGASYTQNLKKVNLSGSSILETVYAGYIPFYEIAESEAAIDGNEWLLDVFNRFGYEAWQTHYSSNLATFPSDAICYQTNSIDTAQDYFTFTSDDRKESSYSNYLADYSERLLAAAETLEHTITQSNGSWAGYKWTRFDESDQFGYITSVVVIDYQGHAYTAKVSLQSQDREEALDVLQARLASGKLSSIEEIKVAVRIRQILDGCDFYNKSAFDAIKSSGIL
ncbi:hypothetical protein SAMN05421749_101397 [Acinetobacter marinus]|uniref:Lipoprotein n=1 Tax=Acinetobacter marinus TaxID=281375 RepID=A0A1G6GVQ8_9GAMM|nr:hypothetical protein [Acinetobacter marinus]SDB85216.1 hypothetical protein SAMN05421749_101397 [Acinetobacter marinus]